MLDMNQARRRAGLVWVGAGLAFQIALVVARQVRPATVTLVLGSVVVLLAVLVGIGAPGAAVLAARRVVSVALALDFGGAVADRFGAFGRPGQPSVSWGSWAAFVDYTQLLLHGVPRPLAEVAAAAATAVEVALSVLLVTGYQRRWVGKAAAGLLVVYLVSMAGSVGLTSVAVYGVPVLVGGALLVSAEPSRRRSANGGSRARRDAGAEPPPGNWGGCRALGAPPLGALRSARDRPAASAATASRRPV